MPTLLLVLDVVLTCLHVAFALAVVTLWVPRRTRRVHRWLLGVTALSWFGCGLWKGLGYCVLTDWHWQVKRARGVTELPWSFIKLAADWVSGGDLDARLVDGVTGAVFVAVVGVALGSWWRDRDASSGVGA